MRAGPTTSLISCRRRQSQHGSCRRYPAKVFGVGADNEGCVGSVGLGTQESRTTKRVLRLEYYPEVDTSRCWHGRHRRLDSDCGFVVVGSGLHNESWHHDRLYCSTENIDRTIRGISSPSPEAMYQGAEGGKDPWFLAMYVLEPLRGKRGLEGDAMSARISVPARAERAKEG
jgi:hypothetical protein